jgi:hypothetical protein
LGCATVHGTPGGGPRPAEPSRFIRYSLSAMNKI